MLDLQHPDSDSVTLDNPITRGDTSIDTITIRKPKTGDLRGLSLAEVMQIDVNAMIKLIPRVSSPALTERDVADLDLSDMTKLCTAVVNFFASPSDRSPTVSMTSSPI